MLPILAAALLVACPLENEREPWYLGLWKFESCSGGYDGTCSGGTGGYHYEVIELTPNQFNEFRNGELYRSRPATYVEEQCITGEVRVNLHAEGGPDWCLYGDREHLGGGEDYPDGLGYSFRRCDLGSC